MSRTIDLQTRTSLSRIAIHGLRACEVISAQFLRDPRVCKRVASASAPRGSSFGIRFRAPSLTSVATRVLTLDDISLTLRAARDLKRRLHHRRRSHSVSARRAAGRVGLLRTGCGNYSGWSGSKRYSIAPVFRAASLESCSESDAQRGGQPLFPGHGADARWREAQHVRVSAAHGRTALPGHPPAHALRHHVLRRQGEHRLHPGLAAERRCTDARLHSARLSQHRRARLCRRVSGHARTLRLGRRRSRLCR